MQGGGRKQRQRAASATIDIRVTPTLYRIRNSYRTQQLFYAKTIGTETSVSQVHNFASGIGTSKAFVFQSYFLLHTRNVFIIEAMRWKL